MSDASTGSNVYLAIGYADGKPVMKVGKANDVNKRKSQIQLDIDLYVECRDEAEAFTLESGMRRAMRSFGAKRHKGNDWFELDVDVFNMVRSFLSDQLGVKMLKSINGKYVDAGDYEVEWHQRQHAAMIAEERTLFEKIQRWRRDRDELDRLFEDIRKDDEITGNTREAEFRARLKTSSLTDLKVLKGHEFYGRNRGLIEFYVDVSKRRSSLWIKVSHSIHLTDRLKAEFLKELGDEPFDGGWLAAFVDLRDWKPTIC